MIFSNLQINDREILKKVKLEDFFRFSKDEKIELR